MTREKIDPAISHLVDTLRAANQHDSYTIGWLSSMISSLVIDSRLKLSSKQKEALLYIIERDTAFCKEIMFERKAA